MVASSGHAIGIGAATAPAPQQVEVRRLRQNVDDLENIVTQMVGDKTRTVSGLERKIAELESMITQAGSAASGVSSSSAVVRGMAVDNLLRRGAVGAQIACSQPVERRVASPAPSGSRSVVCSGRGAPASPGPSLPLYLVTPGPAAPAGAGRMASPLPQSRCAGRPSSTTPPALSAASPSPAWPQMRPMSRTASRSPSPGPGLLTPSGSSLGRSGSARMNQVGMQWVSPQ